MKKKKAMTEPKLRLARKIIYRLDAVQQQALKGDGWTVDIPCLSHKPNSVCDDC